MNREAITHHRHGASRRPGAARRPDPPGPWRRRRTAERAGAAAELHLHPQRRAQDHTNLIGNALVALQQPQQKQWLLQSIGSRPDWAALEPLLSTAVDEFLRLESSNQLGIRRAVRACDVGGVQLDEGALVTLCIGAASRDPVQFDNPSGRARSPSRGRLSGTAWTARRLATGAPSPPCAAAAGAAARAPARWTARRPAA